jgi:hypothetical protein
MSTSNMRLGQPARCVLAGGRTRRSSQARTHMELSREPGCAGIALAPEAYSVQGMSSCSAYSAAARNGRIPPSGANRKLSAHRLSLAVDGSG